MKKLIALCLSLLSICGFAQTGNYFLSHYAQAKQHTNNVCFEMAQDSRGVMYFATNGGVLEFDGKNWDILKGQNQVYALFINASGDIFWGGSNGYGQVNINTQGFQQLDVLSDSIQTDIVQVQSVADRVYFLSEQTLFVYNQTSKTTGEISASTSSGSFTRLFELFGNVYVDTFNEGIFKVDGTKLTPSKLKLSDGIVFVSKIEDKYVLGTTDNALWVLDDSLQPKAINIDDKDYISASVIVSGSWVNKQLVAIGTLRGGVVFVNPITGKTQEIVNYTTGLPDNEVFALMPDRNQNIWIAHDYGFTRVSPYMPFRTFSHYEGLQGNPLCAYSHNGVVYAGTSVGLFKLERQNVYDELVYYVNVEVREAPKTKKKGADKVTKEPEPVAGKTQTESKKRGVFGFLKKNKNKAEETVTAQKPGDNKTTAVTEQPEQTSEVTYRREKRTERVLRASSYSYQKVKGIDAKITHLLAVNGKLVASGLGGIFEVQGLEAKQVLDEPVRYLHASADILFASTYNDKVLALSTDNWKQINSLNNIEDQVNYIFDGKQGELWLCGLDMVYQLEFSKEQISINRKIALENPEMETTLGVSWNDEVLFVNAEGFYQFSRSNNKVVRVDSLPEPAQYFPHDGSILYHGEHGWKLVGKQNEQGNLQLLNLFHDLRFITSDQQIGNLWVISKNNELYKFYGDKISPDEVVFPLFLKTVTNNDLKTGSPTQVHISEDKSAVRFEIVQPDYISPDAVEFRYQLEGMNARWSSWGSNNNVIDFPYLPPGDYTLRVQSKNIFGKIAELKPMQFEVLPPYWKRPWFYSMEFSILATMVLLSFRLSNRLRIVSRLLSLLTIILLIEFIQTMINSTIPVGPESPVVEFISQVIIALMILPVEGYLRNLMSKSMDPSSRIYQLVNFKTGTAKAKVEDFEPVDDDAR